MLLGLMVIMRLVAREAGKEGTAAVAVDLVAAVCLVDGERENVIDLRATTFVWLVLVILYPVKFVREALTLEADERAWEVRGKGIGGEGKRDTANARWGNAG
jgi:hypothetical protein